jgi:hypothetical protein
LTTLVVEEKAFYGWVVLNQVRESRNYKFFGYNQNKENEKL